MDWARAIERNSEALKAIVAALFAMLGNAAVARIQCPLHRAVLRVLRPAESAVRRLIVIAARGLVVKPAAARPKPQGPIGKGKGKRDHLTFPLFDPRKRFDRRRPRTASRGIPRISFLNENYELVTLWSAAPRRPAPSTASPDDGLIDGSRLSLRLEALKRALDDLPRQARRLARARARREKVPRLQLQSVMRPGRPPGYRKVPVHEVDHVLAECHWLARDAMALDTS